MTARVRRKPTRGYVRGLIGAALIVAVALVVVSWGGLGIVLGREPVESEGTPPWFGIVAVGSALVVLGGMLWQQALATLRGNSAPLWGLVLGAAICAYLIWCIFGLLAGLTIEETWLSPFGAMLAPIWAITALIFWGVLVRRVYTDRPTPQWPWERREAEERAAEERAARESGDDYRDPEDRDWDQDRNPDE